MPGNQHRTAYIMQNTESMLMKRKFEKLWPEFRKKKWEKMKIRGKVVEMNDRE